MKTKYYSNLTFLAYTKKNRITKFIHIQGDMEMETT